MTLEASSPPDLSSLGTDELNSLAKAGRAMIVAEKQLAKAGHNLVERLIRDQVPAPPWQHFPNPDAYDYETASQYYFHAHPEKAEELGHFHVFLREEAFGLEARPVREVGLEDSAIAHVVAISMDRQGHPRELFTTNGWVTTEDFYKAEDLTKALPRFSIDHTEPCLAVNQWITAAMRFFRPQIELLLHQRDQILGGMTDETGWESVLEDQSIEVINRMGVSVEAQMREILTILSTRD